MRLRYEPFDPERIGYDVLGGLLSEFYEGPPWNEYRKCVHCSSFGDFGPTGAFGRDEIEARGLAACPACGHELIAYWSGERTRAYLMQLAHKGRLLGVSVYQGKVLAGWIWGYEVTEPHSGRYGGGTGMYIDVIGIPAAFRTGPVAWALVLSVVKDMLERRFSFLVSRTHVRAEGLRSLFRRLGFEEQEASADDPERSYWLRRIDVITPRMLRAGFGRISEIAASSASRAERTG